jgi:hypothetical protein
MIPCDDGEIRMRFLDYFEDTGEGIKYYVDKLVGWQKKTGCRYGAHFAPHDINHHEGFSAETKHSLAEKEGLFFERVPLTKSISDDIETIRRLFNRLEFNEQTCKFGLDLIASFHAKKIERISTEGRPIFAEKPVHDGYDGVSAFRSGIMAWSRGLIRNYGMGEITKVRNLNMPDTYGLDDAEDTRPDYQASYLDKLRDKMGHMMMIDDKPMIDTYGDKE